ncbi:MAG: hypothetical protein II826_04060 [Prevotella sp.]|nr:hypothetical protein [Prevotella sp.]
MKKLLLAFCLLIASANVTNAYQEINLPAITLQLRIKKPVGGGLPFPKNPVTIPEVYLDDHTLYVDNIGDDATIELTDENETVVYSVFVTNGTTTVVLPSTLTGIYELSIIPETGDYYFSGEIEL